ncbi:MAG: LTA synthase family protein [Muribaculaceae bacterium]|nr:LTA synthase family protein [Muribaculaceae bacterium]
MKRFIKYLFGADLWCSRFGVMAATTFGSLLWFIIDWCLGTTFRSMSMWVLWPNNLLAAAILMLPFVISRRVWVQTIWLVLVDMLLMANLMYSRTYFTGIPPESYLLASNLADFTASVWDSLRWADAVFVLILAAGVFFARRLPKASPSRLWGRYGSITAIIAAIALCSVTAKGGFYKHYDKLVESCYTSSCGVPAYTVGGHVAYFIIESRKASDPSTAREIDRWLSEQRSMMAPVALPDSVTPRRNLVIILLESFESWPLGKEVAGKAITPYLNSLLADSTTFYAPKMLTQVDAGRSIDGQLLLTAGMLPMQGTVYSTRYPGSTYLTLNKALKERYGAESSIFTVDQLITWNFGVIARSFGYDHIYDRSFWNNDEKVGRPGKLSDGSFFRQSVEKLGAGELWPEGEPAMLTFVTYSGHNPFRLPDALRDPDFDVRPEGFHKTLENYITMAHYTDSQLHTLIDYLRSRSDWPETMVLITGDHEGLAVERETIRESSAEAAELVDAEQYTPFIVLNAPVGGHYTDVLGQVDMYPTLLAMLGCADYRWQGMGQSLLAKDKIPAAISSMTKELVGDTAGIAPDRLRHWQQARRISDLIIRTDYLANR